MFHTPYEETEEFRVQSESLARVIHTVRDLTRRQVSSVAIFDLDGTLLDNRPRTYYILREIAEVFHDEVPQLQVAVQRGIPLEAIRYGVAETLPEIGVTSAAEAELIRREWSRRFFTDVYQRFDVPLFGATRFVGEVHRAGATVIYLTGRDVSRMLVGTTESLRQYGFPVGVMGTMTIVKSDLSMDDAAFKQETADYLRRLGTVVATFENEPGNANMLRSEFPYADHFLLTTQHSPASAPPDPALVRVRDFHYHAPEPPGGR